MNINKLIILSIIITQIYAQLRYEDCKGDCTYDWIDCVNGCNSIGNPTDCH